MLNILAIIELFLYDICLLCIGVRLLDGEYTKRKILISLIPFIPLSLSMIWVDGDTHGILCGIFNIVIIFLAKYCLKNIRLFSLAYAYFFMFLLNFLFLNCIFSVFSLTESVTWYIELAVNLISAVLCMIVCFTGSGTKVRYVIIHTQKSIKLLLMAILLCCTIISIFTNNGVTINETGSRFAAIKVLLITLIALLCLAMPFLISYSVANKDMKKLTEEYREQIRAQSEQYMLLSEANYELRRFRHDYKNLLIGLNKLIQEGNNQDALKMIEQQNTRLTSSFIKYDTGNGIVDALLTDKQKQAEKIHTTITFEGAVPPDSIDAADLCVIFGNTIDNAIEACGKIKGKEEKTISVESVCNSGFIFIIITNPVVKKVDLKGKLPETTKSDKNKHGFGLYSLSNVVKHYDGELSCECSDNQFQISIGFGIID